MPRSTLTRTALAAVLAVVAMASAGNAAPKRVEPGAVAQGLLVDVVSSESNSIPVPLGVGKSVVIDLPRDVKDVLVADPKIANAVIRSSRRAYLIGGAVGQTNVYFFDAEGKQIVGFDIAVKRDLNGIRAALTRAIPQADIHVEPLGADGIILTGHANNSGEAQQAYDIAIRLLGANSTTVTALGEKVVNAITVRGRDQVMLKVTVAEVQRDVVKQLGIDLSGNLAYGQAVVNFNTANPFGVSGGPISDTFLRPTYGLGTNSVTATIRAMERAGVIRTLAEPNLTAISGESATFIAGGEFPIPNGLSCDTTHSPPICQQQISFKKFGVSLTFTPVVLSEGRISLKVMTEVSDLSSENALTVGVPNTNQSLTIPSVRTRRADTTVEIPSGGSLAMAGMIQEQTKQQINGIPGLMQLPILGTLFRSRDYINRQSELMVLVTPYVVRAVAQKDLSRPDDGFADASDPAGILLGRLNRLYGAAGPRPQPASGSYNGNFGFILD
jgi:pilus assembly protein CpaC